MTASCRLSVNDCRLPAYGASRYRLHRLALAPLISENPAKAFNLVLDTIRKSEEKTFFSLIIDNGMGAIWYESLYKSSESAHFPPEFINSLKNSSLYSTAQYIRQQHTLQKVNDILESKNIPYAVFKGVHTRELIYDNPAVRYACDIDILISKQNRTTAIKALVATGFTFHPIAENISHEGHITKDQTAIDLHWDILRPGRTKIDMTDQFLATRENSSGYWHLTPEAALFIMLVHPVFTKYSTTPHASLIRIIDLIRWIETQEINWEKLQDYLERGGTKTAAWITAAWLEILTGKTLPTPFIQKIKPSGLRAWYLQKWLEKDLSTRLLDHPSLIQACFTLPAHDTLADAVRCTKQILREKKQAEKNTRNLLNEISTS